MILKTTKHKEELGEQMMKLKELNFDNKQKINILENLKREQKSIHEKIEETYQPNTFYSYFISIGGVVISFVIGVLSSLTAAYYLVWRKKKLSITVDDDGITPSS